ncbi:MAG TPA: ABC transporter substrate-binding protein [Xanthobacteraceae bacterium]|jgi:putative ABC transport system substrate-binding protein|nr:ABC transporter substrate-binding protein [Xanthobacteraceae bacterium]
MRRRDFLAFTANAAASAAIAWPLTARAQTDRPRLLGVLMPLSANDPEAKARIGAFLQVMADLGWNDGRNLRIEYRWGTGDIERNRKNAAELAVLAPDVILTTGSPTLEPLLQATRTVPVVFVQVSDPVGAGVVESLARPGGNATGFTSSDYVAAGKWLELLKEVAPNAKRVALLREANNATGIGQWGASEAFAGSFNLDLQPINTVAFSELERAITHFATGADCGMVVTNGAPAIVHRDLIIGLAARHRLPAIYPQRLFATAGGLISYGSDAADSYRRAAAYIDRILKGTKPSDLPVQNPTKYELVINLKTAKAQGLTVPPSLLTRADEVIE